MFRTKLLKLTRTAGAERHTVCPKAVLGSLAERATTPAVSYDPGNTYASGRAPLKGPTG